MENQKIGSKWCKSTEADDSGALLRAKATKARLHDLEADMFDRSEKQVARDRRLANMKRVLADNDADSAMQSLSISSKMEKHVSF